MQLELSIQGEYLIHNDNNYAQNEVKIDAMSPYSNMLARSVYL